MFDATFNDLKPSSAASRESTRSAAIILEPIMMNVATLLPQKGFLEDCVSSGQIRRTAEFRRSKTGAKLCGAERRNLLA